MQKTKFQDIQPMNEEEIDRNLDDSFPASDPHSWTLGTNHFAPQTSMNTLEPARANRERYLLSRRVDGNDHIRGNDHASVTLLMYGAFECPFCVEGSRVVRQLEAQFGEALRFVFRHFPRTNIHPHSEAAAEVAEAAGEQNKFWEMHDLLFENYNRLDGEHLIDYASTLGLDMERFGRAITSRVFARRVQEDLISGTESGVKGTPTYFINGVKYVGSGQFDALIVAVESGIVRSGNF
jgi:protein-disulfide isomerase